MVIKCRSWNYLFTMWAINPLHCECNESKSRLSVCLHCFLLGLLMSIKLNMVGRASTTCVVKRGTADRRNTHGLEKINMPDFWFHFPSRARLERSLLYLSDYTTFYKWLIHDDAVSKIQIWLQNYQTKNSVVIIEYVYYITYIYFY